MGAAKLGGEDLNYLGVAGLRIAGGQGILIIAICQVRLEGDLFEGMVESVPTGQGLENYIRKLAPLPAFRP